MVKCCMTSLMSYVSITDVISNVNECLCDVINLPEYYLIHSDIIAKGHSVMSSVTLAVRDRRAGRLAVRDRNKSPLTNHE